MNKRRIVLSGICFLLFLIVFLFTFSDHVHFFDQEVYHLVRMLDSDFFDMYFVFITKFGNVTMITILILTFIFLFRNRYAIILGGLGCISVISNTFIKVLVQRDRPDVLRLIEQGGYSFPSGHAMISICVYGYLLYLVFIKIKHKVLKYGLGILLSILIISIGISRIYVGVHYASDVLAGYFLAISITLLIIELSNRYYVRGCSNVQNGSK